MVKTVLKSDRKSLRYSFSNLVTPEIKVLRKMHLNFRILAQKSVAIIKKNTFKIKKDLTKHHDSVEKCRAIPKKYKPTKK